MALDPTIIQNIRQADPAGDIAQGLRVAKIFQALQQERELAPLRRQRAQQQVEAGDLSVQQSQRKVTTENLSFLRQSAEQLRELPTVESRRQALGLLTPRLNEMGIDSAQIGASDLTDESLNSFIASIPDLTQQQVVERFSPTTTTLPDGTTISTTSAGRKIVTDAAGAELTGSEAIQAVKRAEEFKTEQQIARAGGRTAATLQAELEAKPAVEATTVAAKTAIKQSEKAFERLEPLTQGLSNFDEAVSLIDQGATTGTIVGRLPSIRRASIELDSLQKRLGLDVIAGTTFGALSEGEREFALSSVLPKNLKPQDLRKWLVRKKQSQEKLIAQLQEAAVFLGTPGNTIADFIEIKRLDQLDREAPIQDEQGQADVAPTQLQPDVAPTQLQQQTFTSPGGKTINFTVQ